jgi:hypothetical protein
MNWLKLRYEKENTKEIDKSLKTTLENCMQVRLDAILAVDLLTVKNLQVDSLLNENDIYQEKYVGHMSFLIKNSAEAFMLDHVLSKLRNDTYDFQKYLSTEKDIILNLVEEDLKKELSNGDQLKSAHTSLQLATLRYYYASEISEIKFKENALKESCDYYKKGIELLEALVEKNDGVNLLLTIHRYGLLCILWEIMTEKSIEVKKLASKKENTEIPSRDIENLILETHGLLSKLKFYEDKKVFKEPELKDFKTVELYPSEKTANNTTNTTSGIRKGNYRL